jgi:hypothetical protein
VCVCVCVCVCDWVGVARRLRHPPPPHSTSLWLKTPLLSAPWPARPHTTTHINTRTQAGDGLSRKERVLRQLGLKKPEQELDFKDLEDSSEDDD